MSDLDNRLAEARAEVSRLERAAAAASCRELGRHEWISIGGANAGCGDRFCACSVPVYECVKCGDCDYGDNDEADRVRGDCRALQ
jgi:hypothetical protein